MMVKKIFLFIVLWIPLFACAIPPWGERKVIYKDDVCTVEIQFKLRDNSCLERRTNKYRLNVKGKHTYSKEFNWNFQYRNCEGNLVPRQVRLSIGGPNAKEGLLESMDYTFTGVLGAVIEYSPLQGLLKKFDQELRSMNLIDAKSTYLEITRYTNDTILLRTKNKALGEALVRRGEGKFNDYLKNELYYEDAADLLTSIEKISSEFNLENSYLIKSLTNRLESNALKKTESLLNSNRYEGAIVMYKFLYNLTSKGIYQSSIQKIEQLIADQTERRIQDYYEELKKKAKEEPGFKNVLAVYEYQQKNTSILSPWRYDANGLSILLAEDVKAKYKESKSSLKEKDLVSAQDHIHDAFELQSNYSYKKYYEEDGKMWNKVLELKNDIDEKKMDLASWELKRLKYRYQYLKYHRRTLRIGLSYNLYSSSPSFVDQGTKEYDGAFADLSWLNFNAFYGRFGIYVGDLWFSDSTSTEEIPFQYNAGLYFKLYKGLYLRGGVVNPKFRGGTYYVPGYDQYAYPSKVYVDRPYYCGLSLITPIELELGYNLYTNTYSISLGLSLWRRHKKFEEYRSLWKTYKI